MGIQIKPNGKAHSIKISQFADDTILLLWYKHEVSYAMNKIEIVISFSGLELNRNKY